MEILSICNVENADPLIYAMLQLQNEFLLKILIFAYLIKVIHF